VRAGLMADAVAVSLSESAQMYKFLSRFAVNIDKTFGSFASGRYQGFYSWTRLKQFALHIH